MEYSKWAIADKLLTSVHKIVLISQSLGKSTSLFDCHNLSAACHNYLAHIREIWNVALILKYIMCNCVNAEEHSSWFWGGMHMRWQIQESFWGFCVFAFEQRTPKLKNSFSVNWVGYDASTPRWSERTLGESKNIVVRLSTWLTLQRTPILKTINDGSTQARKFGFLNDAVNAFRRRF